MTDKTHRSAVTGKFVTAEHAAENPDTTVSEKRTRRPASDYSNLRKLAEACPPEDDANSEWYSEDRLEVAICTADRPFVATCSPTVVLGLLDELDRLRASLAEAASTGEPIVRTVGDLTARHIGKRVRVEGCEYTLDHIGPSKCLFILGPGGYFPGQQFLLDTPCEVLP